MKLNLCWKTCDHRIVKYFRSISPDQTEGEGRFLAEFFLSGDKPVYHTLLLNHFPTVYRNNRHTKMTQNKLIYISNYDKDGGVCRTYKLTDQTRQAAFLHCLINNISLAHEEDEYTFEPGSSDKQNKVMMLLMSNKMPLEIATLRDLIADASDKGRILEPRVVSDTNTIVKMLGRADPYTDQDDIIYIPRRLRPSEHGRVYEIQGGVQYLSRKSKKINYSRPNVYNYDIRCCALSALVYYCKLLNIECDSIVQYVNDPDLKHKHANEVGISVDCWKKCLLSALFGGRFDGLGSIATNIRDDVGQKAANETYAKFVTVSEPYVSVIFQWLASVQDFAKDQMNSDGTIFNAAGCAIKLKDDSKQIINKKTLCSFYLQGLESAFIFDLIIASQNKFRILSYEFDGLVTEGKIPPEIIEQCRISSGFTNVIIEVKEF